MEITYSINIKQNNTNIFTLKNEKNHLGHHWNDIKIGFILEAQIIWVVFFPKIYTTFNIVYFGVI